MKDYTTDITTRFLLIKDEVIRQGVCKTLKEFAEKVGEHPQNFSKMENGTRFPTLDHVARACAEFGYCAQWVVLGKGPKRTDKKDESSIEKRVSDLEIQVRSIKRKLEATN